MMKSMILALLGLALSASATAGDEGAKVDGAKVVPASPTREALRETLRYTPLVTGSVPARQLKAEAAQARGQAALRAPEGDPLIGQQRADGSIAIGHATTVPVATSARQEQPE